MEEFKKGEKVPLEGRHEAVIVKKLGQGGQGIVYSVSVDGKPYALKWYTCKFADKEAFKKNMLTHIINDGKGPPDRKKFLWPLYLTSEKSKSFGYVMDLRPKNYTEFSDILNNMAKFPSTDIMITAALNIVNAFRLLHHDGLSYQDLNDGNFFINVANGDVLVCDNDNVTPDGKKNAGGIGGKPGYMAPEIVRGETHPYSLTDCHSLAVILFKLFLRHDPLMGKAYVDSVCITEKREYELYGTQPVFIFDPRDTSNRPVKGVHPNPIRLWPLFPPFFQDAFVQSFSEGMKDPNRRLPENEWQKILIRLRDEVLECPVCKTDLWLNTFPSGTPIKCTCGSAFSYPMRLKTDRYGVPLFPGTNLYACHTSADAGDYSTITGEVIMNKNNPSLWGIRNLSKDSWLATPAQGEGQNIDPNGVVLIGSNLTIQFNGVTAKIIKE
jgi:DNA-binding helix-hairpin-helix protein with protein kinase domain